MGKFFNLDAPVIQWLGKVGQMMLTSVTWLICCLPIFTIGAATAALYRMMFNLKEDRSCALKDFFRAFRENFRKATALWLILLVCIALLVGLYWVTLMIESAGLRVAVLMVFCTVFFVLYIAGLYLFPLTVYFENSVLGTLRNAVAMGLGNLRQSIIAGAVTMIPLLVLMVSMQIFVQMLFLWVVLAPGAIAYGVACALRPVFLRYVPGTEEYEEGLV